MPYDVSVPLRGAAQFDETGDLFLSQGVDLANQRIARRLYTNPVTKSSDGEIVQAGDDPFNQDYGIGLGRKVDSILDSATLEDIVVDIKTGFAQEEMVDQTLPVGVGFFENPRLNAEIVVIDYTLLDGRRGEVGFGL